MSPVRLVVRYLFFGLIFTSNLVFAASVQLAWTPNPENDVSGYAVYRTQTPGVGFVKINSGLSSGASFTDSTVLPGIIYYYIITAVNTSGQESPFSSEVQAQVPYAAPMNRLPTPVAGPDQTVVSGSLVTLAGSGSDPDGDPLTFSWGQISGPTVSIQGANTKVITFTAPTVSVATPLVFRLTANDGRGGTASDDVSVSVQPSANRAPTANAGVDQIAPKSQKVYLKGSGSDPDGDTLTYSWSQISGTPVTLSGATTATASFTAPRLSTQTDLVFRFTVKDTRNASATDDAKVTVLKNNPPKLTMAPQTAASTGDSVTLAATATDADGDPLVFSWEQLSGPAVSTSALTQPALLFRAPRAETELVFRVVVSDPLEAVEGEARVLVRTSVPLVVPANLRDLDPLLSNSFVGLAFLNDSATSRALNIDAVNELGFRTRLGASTYEPGRQRAFLASSIPSLPGDVVSIRSEAADPAFHSFFLAGDFNTARLDGVGGELPAARNLLFPLATDSAGQRTVIFLSNPDPVTAADMRLQLVNGQGAVVREAAFALPARGARVAPMGELFPNVISGNSSYVRLISSTPAQGLELVASAQSFTSSSGLEPMPVRTLWSPHFILGRNGEDTELRFINGDPSVSVPVKLSIYAETGALLGTHEFTIPAAGLSVRLLSSVLGLNAIPPGASFMSGHLTAEVGASQASVVAAVTFTANHGQARSTLPMWRAAQTETLFMHIAQSAKNNVFTGLVVLNPNSGSASVVVEAFDENGLLTARKMVPVAAGARLIDLLGGDRLFGAGFAQVGGHLRVSSDYPVVSFAMFGDYTAQYLAAVEGQKAR